MPAHGRGGTRPRVVEVFEGPLEVVFDTRGETMAWRRDAQSAITVWHTETGQILQVVASR
jgi:YD repeat-containing protein